MEQVTRYNLQFKITFPASLYISPWLLSCTLVLFLGLLLRASKSMSVHCASKNDG
jgi:hypothetical protein